MPARLLAFCPKDEICTIVGPAQEAYDGLPLWQSGFLMDEDMGSEMGTHVIPFLGVAAHLARGGEDQRLPRLVRFRLGHVRLSTPTARTS